MGLALGKKPGTTERQRQFKKSGSSHRHTNSMSQDTAEMYENEANVVVLKDLGIAKMRRCRVCYFTDGAVIGSREFVNEVFMSAHVKFGANRKDGARSMKGGASAARGIL